MTRLLPIAVLLLAPLVLLPSATAHAHGFGERYDLPVPLWLYMYGAGATVLVSFVVIGLFLRGEPGAGTSWRLNVYRLRGLRPVLESPVTITALRLVSAAALGLTIATAFWGNQAPSLNFSVAFVWITWLVGMGYVFSLVGNLWALLNPWTVIFQWLEALYTRVTGRRRLGLGLEYPQELGVTPAIVLFAGFAWVENVYVDSATPVYLGVIAAFYSVVTLGGMFLYGKHTWLHHGEAFHVLYRFLSRFAITEARATDPDACAQCELTCATDAKECVDCYSCFERTKGRRELNLRLPGAGLTLPHPLRTTEVVFVVLALSTVTFDGFKETEAWLDIKGRVLLDVTFYGSDLNSTLALFAFPLILLGAYLVTCKLSGMLSGERVGTGEMARAFMPSLIPIALAYNVAHYFSYLAIQGQLIVQRISDPFGWGWDLFGTASWQTVNTIVGARLVWFVGVAAIVIGHVIAVYVAHVISVRMLSTRAAAMRSQNPMVILMVGYTVLSLWIVAQPIVLD